MASVPWWLRVWLGCPSPKGHRTRVSKAPRAVCPCLGLDVVAGGDKERGQDGEGMGQDCEPPSPFPGSCSAPLAPLPLSAADLCWWLCRWRLVVDPQSCGLLFHRCVPRGVWGPWVARWLPGSRQCQPCPRVPNTALSLLTRSAGSRQPWNICSSCRSLPSHSFFIEMSLNCLRIY